MAVEISVASVRPVPRESPLVHFDFAIPRRAHRTLVGMGDFREVRRYLRKVEST